VVDEPFESEGKVEDSGIVDAATALGWCLAFACRGCLAFGWGFAFGWGLALRGCLALGRCFAFALRGCFALAFIRLFVYTCVRKQGSSRDHSLPELTPPSGAAVAKGDSAVVAPDALMKMPTPEGLNAGDSWRLSRTGCTAASADATINEVKRAW
jgi:hypothetical protein